MYRGRLTQWRRSVLQISATVWFRWVTPDVGSQKPGTKKTLKLSSVQKLIFTLLPIGNSTPWRLLPSANLPSATPPLGNINTSPSPHVYVDDTQFSTSFVPKDFLLAINQLELMVSTISFVMKANLLILSPSKTEVTLSGFPQQLRKMHSPSLTLPSAQPILPSHLLAHWASSLI